MDSRLFARIQSLFDVRAFSELNVLVAGCGSGGSQVALNLVMSGVRHFTLVDCDILKLENVIRHACGMRYLGRPKVAAVAGVLRDRNPEVTIRKFEMDLQTWDSLEFEIRSAHVVVLATDNDPTRYLINELCVRTHTPFVVGRVFTRGIGGEAFAYRPNTTGCLACLENYLDRSGARTGVREIDYLSDAERDQALYGLEPTELKDSPGLAVDIGFITAFHTRLVLDALGDAAPNRPRFLTPISENYFVWGNRPTPPFQKHFQLQRFKLMPQAECRVCRSD